MKLRIHKNSLRFRFDRKEVERLDGGESLEASIRLGPAANQLFTYCVVPQEGAVAGRAARVRFERQCITVTVSPRAVKQWHEGADLALTAEETWDGYTLQLLLEKDMQRLNPKPGEESPDVYPNPLFGKARCKHS